MEEIRCKIVPKPERNTKTIIGGGENYGERPLFVGQGTGFKRYSCGNCKLILVDNVDENIGSNMMDRIFILACDCFDNFSDTFTTTRVKIKPTIHEGNRFLLKEICLLYYFSLLK